MAKKFLDDNGLLYVWGKIKSYISGVIDALHLSDTYVAKEQGKGLSTNDYTTTEKNKLNSIEAGAEVNVNADWNAASGDAQILNKPSIPNKTSQLTNDSGYITIADVPEGAAASTTTPKMDGTAAVGTESAFARGDHRHPSDTSKQDVINDLADIRSGASAGATAYQKPSGGIPKSDLISSVQASLDLADTALQSSDIAGKVDKSTTVNGHALSNNVTVTKSDVGLGDVTNDAQVKRTEMGVANGVATLDNSGKVPAAQLPSYVDDVIESYARSGQTPLSQDWLATGSASGTVITPEAGKIYVLMADSGEYAANTQFRWGGSAYVKLNDGGVSAITNAEIDTIIV